MLRKINKQREKIEKLFAKENDVAEKLIQLRQELAEEREALDEMEKEYLFSLMRERALSLEETIALLESGAADMPEDAETEQEQEEISGMEDAAENIFTEDTTDDFEKEPDEEIAEENLAEGFSFPASEETERDDSFFSRFGKKEETGDDGFWQ